MPSIEKARSYLDIKLGKRYLFFNKRYKVISTLNDLSTGIWFVLGSILFLFETPGQTVGNIFFLLGSLQLLARPIIRIAHDSSLRSYSARYVRKVENHENQHNAPPAEKSHR